MPEFEETQPNSNAKQNYTPSVDAAPKRKNRRRSGGFKTDIANFTSAQMGEVDPATALKQERLSGSSKAGQRPDNTEASRPEKNLRDTQKQRAAKNSKSRQPKTPEPTKSEGSMPASPKETKQTRTAPTNTAQPSAKTLAAIKAVEERIAGRKAERDKQRKDNPRKSDRPAKTNKKASGQKPKNPRQQQSPQNKSNGESASIFARISAFFGKMLGSEPAPKARPNDRKQPSRNGHPNRSSNQPRNSQNRSSNNNKGRRGGQNKNRTGNNQRSRQNRKPRNASQNDA